MKKLLVVVVVAIGGYYVWSHYFSQAAKIERAYQACMKQIAQGMDKAKADIDAKTPIGNDPSAAMARGMADAMTQMMQAMGGATCGAMKESCRQDFNGPICQAAINNVR